MKKELIVVINIIFLLIGFNLVYAQEIEFNYPDSVGFEEEFEVNLVLNDFELDVYDIKIDITGEGKRISQIKNKDNFQSTFNYLLDIIDTNDNNEHSFILKITEEFTGIGEIIVKIRDSGNHKEEFSGYEINIVQDEENPKESNETEEEENEEESNETEEEDEINIEIDWDEDEIINGDEFEIKVKAFNLEDKIYDIRLWIEFEDNTTVISDRYDDEADEWKSGRYYVSSYFDGPGDKEDEITLKIREEYIDFEGDAIIFFKLRDSITINEIIEILEKDETNSEVASSSEENSASFNSQNKVDLKEDEKTISGNVIKLNAEKIRFNEEVGQIIYESKLEKIKKYSTISFAGLCLVLCILLIWTKLKI